MMEGMKILVAVLVCASLSLAQPPPWETVAANFTQTLEEEKVVIGSARISAWLIISVIVCSIALTATALIWMIGVIIANDRVKALAKAEFAQAFACLLLIGLFFVYDAGSVAFVEAMRNATDLLIVRAALGEAEATGARIYGGPYTIAYLFLKSMAQCAENKFMEHYNASGILQIVGNMGLRVSSTAGEVDLAGLAITPIAWRYVFDHEFLASEYAWLTFLIYLQINLLRWIETSAFIVFFPTGLALRAFPPTRGAGAVLMALSIGLYFVYPTLYAILILSMPDTIAGCAQKPRISIHPTQMQCPLAASAPVEAALALTTPPSPEEEKAYAESIQISGELRYVTIAFFIITLGATFIFIRSISGMLGADISEIGRSMIRMI